jgi:hypothetical protein
VAIDAMTANKALKLWKFELENEEWSIIEDLTAILLATTVVHHLLMVLMLLHSNTKMPLYFSPRIPLVLWPLSLLWIV